MNKFLLLLKKYKLLLMFLIITLALAIAYKNISFFSFIYSKPVCTIDINKIIQYKKDQLAIKYKDNMDNSPDAKAKMLDESIVFINEVTNALNAYAAEQNILIISSQTIVAGNVKDITEEVLKAYKESNK